MKNMIKIKIFTVLTVLMSACSAGNENKEIAVKSVAPEVETEEVTPEIPGYILALQSEIEGKVPGLKISASIHWTDSTFNFHFMKNDSVIVFSYAVMPENLSAERKEDYIVTARKQSYTVNIEATKLMSYKGFLFLPNTKGYTSTKEELAEINTLYKRLYEIGFKDGEWPFK